MMYFQWQVYFYYLQCYFGLLGLSGAADALAGTADTAWEGRMHFPSSGCLVTLGRKGCGEVPLSVPSDFTMSLGMWRGSRALGGEKKKQVVWVVLLFTVESHLSFAYSTNLLGISGRVRSFSSTQGEEASWTGPFVVTGSLFLVPKDFSVFLNEGGESWNIRVNKPTPTVIGNPMKAK